VHETPGATAEEVLCWLESHANAENVAGMARYGIRTRRALGVCAPMLRAKARELGRDHRRALELWASGVHEARILAALTADPGRVTPPLMIRWAREFDSWAICDGVCCNLFDRTPHAWRMAVRWACDEREFVKRAAFALMAALTVHDKMADDERFLRFLPLIERAAEDDRNFVRKAVNWALRQIGKRSLRLNAAAIRAAGQIARRPARSARWIAADALRELQNDRVRARIPRRRR
jgi:3-methyladenine DNA glycosylase AlkD